jgi:hypothetical protein
MCTAPHPQHAERGTPHRDPESWKREGERGEERKREEREREKEKNYDPDCIPTVFYYDSAPFSFQMIE